MLRVEEVAFAYDGRVRALDALSFEVNAGGHSLLLGPSGSGKTTLIYLIAGLLTPRSGRIVFEGEDISAMSQSARDALRRRKIGVVFQTLRLVSALSVEANLLLAQRLAGLKRDQQAVRELLERLGLSARVNAKPHELSVGQAQRAALGRAIITKPKLLIADEPTSALDDANASNVADLLEATAQQNGATLLIATHDQRLKDRFPAAIRLGSSA